MGKSPGITPLRDFHLPCTDTKRVLFIDKKISLKRIAFIHSLPGIPCYVSGYKSVDYALHGRWKLHRFIQEQMPRKGIHH